MRRAKVDDRCNLFLDHICGTYFFRNSLAGSQVCTIHQYIALLLECTFVFIFLLVNLETGQICKQSSSLLCNLAIVLWQ